MSVEVFIVAHFDSGKLCMTTSRPQARSVGGVEYLFTNQIADIRLPNREIKPLSDSVSDQKVSVDYFDKSLSPGLALNSRSRFQGRPVQVFVFDDSGSELLAFEGEIDSFGYDIEDCKASFTASSQRSSTKTLFPPGSLLEDGRFVERRVLDTGEYTQTSYNQQIQYLVPLMEFNSAYGTPSSPIQNFTFRVTPVSVAPGVVANPDGSYLFFDDRATDLAVPVIYGTNSNVALNILGHYRVDNGSDYVKVYICIVASHRVIGDPSFSSGSNPFAAVIKYNNIAIPSSVGGVDTDRLNSEFSYITVPVLYSDADYEDLQPLYSSNFDIYQSYISSIVGKPSVDGSAISGLYDVVQDMWLSYGGGRASQVDWKSSSQSRSSLNALEVSAVFNARAENQTLLDILSQRFQSQFPVSFSFPLGRIAWQGLFFRAPSSNPDPVKVITLGQNALSRGGVSQTGISDIVNNLKVSFGINGNSGEDAESILLDSHSSGIAKASEDRWGKSDLSEMRVQDSSFVDTVSLIASNRLLKSAGVRFEVSYTLSDLSFVSLPFMSIISVTDDQCAFEDEPFYFLGISWEDTLEVFSVKLLSVKMI
tara:strand:+ start:2896 stop:4671 length:1776 start_codon:yes stop_codon:yes gene_type:complete